MEASIDLPPMEEEIRDEDTSEEKEEAMTDLIYTYENADGERIEATSHEFVTRLKGLGFRRVVEEEPTGELQEVTPEFDHGVDQPESEAKRRGKLT